MALLTRWFGGKTIQDNSRFGYCVVGTGHGAKKMCEALRDSPHARVAAVMSSSAEKARRFADRYGAAGAYSYEQVGELSRDASVEAVYLALPVTPHARFTLLAASAGKHVLCEKPMAASIEDAEAMIAACAQAGRLLMIAYRLDYDPMYAEAARLLDASALGRVQLVTSAFGIVAKTGWRFDPAMAGGGSLFDVGVYPVHAIQSLFGDAEIENAHVQRQDRTGMEVDAVWQGRLPNGAAFECRSSYMERVPDALRITGERGWLELRHAFAYERTQLRAEYRDSNGKIQRLALRDEYRNASLFRLEAEHLAECARGAMPVKSPGEDGLRDMRTMRRIEAIAASPLDHP